MRATQSFASDPPATTLLQSLLIRLIRVGLFAIPFFALLIVTSFPEAAETPKVFAFRITVEILTGLWLTLLVFFPQYRPRRSWVLTAFALFVMVMALADAQGVDRFNSFWSPTRLVGWITLIHLFAYIVIASSMLTTDKLWLSLFRLSLAISVLVSIFGILELLNLSPLHRLNNDWRYTRMIGTFGNEMFLSVYMLFHIFIAALLWATTPESRVGSRTRSIARSAYAAVIFIDMFALFASGTRGVILGLAVGITVSSALFAIIHTSSRVRLTGVAVVIGILLFGAAFSVHGSFLRNIPTLSRLASLSLSDEDVSTRYYTYAIAWQGFLARPILGWGEENFDVVYGRYYNFNIEDKQWTSRVHDIILEVLVGGGLVGLLADLAIFFAALWSLWRRTVFTPPERCILTGLLAAYVFQNLFEFDSATSCILFGTVLAYIVWRADVQHQDRDHHILFANHSLPVRFLPIVAIPIISIALTVAWFANADAIRAEIALGQLGRSSSSTAQEVFQGLQKVISYGTFFKPTAISELAAFADSVAANNTVDADLKQQIFTYTQQQLQDLVNESPLNVRGYGNLGALESLYGDYRDAAIDLGTAHTLSPRNQWFLVDMAKNKLASGDDATALQYLKSALELRPETVDIRIEYAAVAIQISNYDLADQLLAPIINDDTAADPRIVRAYMMRGRADKIIAVTAPYAKAHPADQWGYLVLAAAYYSMGDDAVTVDMLLEAKKVAATNSSDLDNLIEHIRTSSVPRSDTMKTILTLAGF